MMTHQSLVLARRLLKSIVQSQQPTTYKALSLVLSLIHSHNRVIKRSAAPVPGTRNTVALEDLVAKAPPLMALMPLDNKDLVEAMDITTEISGANMEDIEELLFEVLVPSAERLACHSLISASSLSV